MTVRKKKRPLKLTYRDMGYLKPPKFKNHLTLMELGRLLGKDVSWIKDLEAAGRIPEAIRYGPQKARLWSPEQVKEIEFIFSQMKVGRPRGS